MLVVRHNKKKKYIISIKYIILLQNEYDSSVKLVLLLVTRHVQLFLSQFTDTNLSCFDTSRMDRDG
jgi:hypothetical protein